MDYHLPDSSVYGISQARILEWVAISFSRGSSQSRDQTHVSCIGRQILYHWATGEAPTVNITLVFIRSQLTFLREGSQLIPVNRLYLYAYLRDKTKTAENKTNSLDLAPVNDWANSDASFSLQGQCITLQSGRILGLLFEDITLHIKAYVAI